MHIKTTQKEFKKISNLMSELDGINRRLAQVGPTGQACVDIGSTNFYLRPTAENRAALYSIVVNERETIMEELMALGVEVTK